MRSFGLVDQKLEEADFFCEKIAESGANFYLVKNYFSAFVGAARSVTFAIQGSISSADGFEKWYSGWQARLRTDRLAKFFHACRTDSQHLGLNPIRGGYGRPGHKGYCVFGQPEAQRYAWLPEQDVASACKEYLRTICEIVADCYREFGLLIDPAQIYTAAGLASKGWTLEDVEEQLGFPRGYTDIPWDGEDKFEQRLKLLRRNIAMSRLAPLLKKYLGDADPLERAGNEES